MSNWKSKNAYTIEQINNLPKQIPNQNSSIIIDTEVKEQTNKLVEENNKKTKLYSDKNYLDLINKIGEIEYQIALSTYNDNEEEVKKLEEELQKLNLEKERIENSKN